MIIYVLDQGKDRRRDVAVETIGGEGGIGLWRWR
jgi:hypothetical protein